MKKKTYAFRAVLAALSLVVALSCGKDDGPGNTPPTIENQTLTAAEKVAPGVPFGAVAASDEDPNDDLEFSITQDADDLFDINSSSGQVSLATGKSFDRDNKSQHSIEVTVSDGEAESSATITINVLPGDGGPSGDAAPVIEDQAFEAAEDLTDADTIATVTATDEDEGDTLFFSITEDASGLFVMDDDGNLGLAEGQPLDFEGDTQEYEITVQVSDGDQTDTATITITVTDVNEPPVVNSELEFSVLENVNDIFIIGVIKAEDPEGDTIEYIILTDADDLFEIDINTGEISLRPGKQLNHDVNTSHTITISVLDKKEGNPLDVDIIINVENVDTLAEDPNAFVTRWNVTQGDLDITIGTDPNYQYNYTIDWGDGTQENVTQDGNIEHEYEEAGTYTVAIVGTFPAINMSISDQSSRQALVRIDQWGGEANVWQTMVSAFEDCINLQYAATDLPNLSQVTSLSRMFMNASSFNGDVSGWDISNVTNLISTFREATAFEGTGVAGWETENVTSMLNTFRDASNFNQSLGDWDITSLDGNNDLVGFLSGSGLSCVNYGATLTGWYNDGNSDLLPNMNVGVSGMQYNSFLQATVVNGLINDFGWDFNGHTSVPFNECN